MLLNLGCCVDMQLLSWPGHAASKDKIYIYKKIIKFSFHNLKKRRANCSERNHLLFIRLHLLSNSHQGAIIVTAWDRHVHMLSKYVLPASIQDHRFHMTGWGKSQDDPQQEGCTTQGTYELYVMNREGCIRRHLKGHLPDNIL